jgi:Domain of unknown function (DUF1963)
MDDKAAEWADFRETAEEEGLGGDIEWLVALCVPSLRLVPTSASTLKSRLGGLPDVSPGFSWPRSSLGEALAFVAQIDLAEVNTSGLATAGSLPARGLLSFFHGYEPSPNRSHTASAGRVFFFEGPTAPADRPAEDGAVLPVVPITWSLQTEELPPVESPFYADLLAGGDLGLHPVSAAAEVFAGMIDTYAQVGLRDEDDRPVHRLLGYADPLQSDVYVDAEGMSGRIPFDQWTTPAVIRAAARWRLLLQIDSDASRGMMFGDGGVLSFMIREEDLAARRFDRVWVAWQSH